MTKLNYGSAICEGFRHLLANHSEVFAIGQGLWSPWYVGNSMTNLDRDFGKERIIDTPVSEASCTGLAIGASLCGYRPIVIHPRMDFMILATDPIVNQAAKWSHMLGGQAHPAVTIRGIVNRGGEQGAQHSQSLHSWFSHVPGLRVVMPASVQDARDLLISATLCDDPVLYIDDRWLYEQEADVPAYQHTPLEKEGPKVSVQGQDITIVGAGHSVKLAAEAAQELKKEEISAEIVDLRVVNPLKYETITASVKKTGRLLVVDGGWETCGLGGEIIAGVSERLGVGEWKAAPARIALPHAPAPTSAPLEKLYYPTVKDVVYKVKRILNQL